MDDIKILEKEIDDLQKTLKQKKKNLYKLRLEKEKDKSYEDYKDFVSRKEMELVYQLLFGYLLSKDYQYPFANKYIEKAASFLNIFPDDIFSDFENVIVKFDEYEEFIDEEEVCNLMNNYAENQDLLDGDDIDAMIEAFC